MKLLDQTLGCFQYFATSAKGRIVHQGDLVSNFFIGYAVLGAHLMSPPELFMDCILIFKGFEISR